MVLLEVERFVVFLCSRDGGNREAPNDEPDDRNQLSEPLRHVAELIFFFF